MQTTDDARLALDAVGAAEHDLSRLAVCPPWRHAAFAGLMAVWVAAPAIAMPLRFGLFAVLLGVVAVIVRSDRRRLGVFINGYRRGKTRQVIFPMLLVLMTLFGASTYFGDLHHERLVSVALAVVAFPIAYYGSALWQRVFVRELGR